MFHFIANPKSGQGKTLRYCDKVRRYCDKHGIDYAFHYTEYAGHAKKLVGEIEAAGGTDIVVFGGDGTFHEALNGITQFDRTVLGLVPCGSGNDFIKSGKFYQNKPVKAIKAMLTGRTRKIDYIQFASGVRCLNVAGTGLDIEVLLKARAMRRILGKPNYVAALLRTLRHFHPYTLTVTANGKTETYDTFMVGVCNGRQIGGGIKISPNSDIADGKLRVVIMKMVERHKIKYILPKFMTGKHLNEPYCVHFETDAVRVTNEHRYRVELDGEIYHDLDFDCHIVSGGLTLFGS